MSKSSYLFRIFLLFVCVFVIWVFPVAAKTWKVSPNQSREEIQEIIDSASDGDRIYFQRGLYDLSGIPMDENSTYHGAFEFTDKSLTIQGHPQAVIYGPGSYEESGIYIGTNCFLVSSPNTHRKVVFHNLHIENFMRGICVWDEELPYDLQDTLPCYCDLIIQNCVFKDTGTMIGQMDLMGNITIQGNEMNDCRALYLAWGREDGQYQPDNTVVRIENNKFYNLNDTIYNYGFIYVERANRMIIRNNYFEGGWGWKMRINGSKNYTFISKNVLKDVQQGIWFSFFYDQLGYPSLAQNVTIEKNHLSGVTRHGIQVMSVGSENNRIADNEIEMVEGSIYSISLECQNTLVEGNTVTGQGQTAVRLRGWDYSESGKPINWAENNSILNNWVHTFIPEHCHYLLNMYSRNNLVIGNGQSGIIVDDIGINNTIINIPGYDDH